jgi:hypothetical protein
MMKVNCLLVLLAGLSATLALNLDRPCPTNINALTGFDVASVSEMKFKKTTINS